MTRPHIAWILGSGFSRALGGPTLSDLLSFEAEQDLEEVFRGDPRAFFKIQTRETVAARRLYHYGIRYARGTQWEGDRELVQKGLGENLWPDPEAYLDVLEAAAASPDGPLAARLMNVVSHSLKCEVSGGIKMVRDAAVRCIALECSRFLFDVDTSTERWSPYVRWRHTLQRNDARHTIITFNYDGVLELLGMGNVVWLPGRAPPRFIQDLPDDEADLHVAKLHGSVDWRRSGSVGRFEYHVADDPRSCATCGNDELIIATPGMAKQNATRELQALWNGALARLRKATAVVFLGYRFPPTDAEARERLLGSLPSGRIPIHVVLGEDTNHPHVRRLQGLLGFASRQADVQIHPLYVEDFLSLAWLDDIARSSE